MVFEVYNWRKDAIERIAKKLDIANWVAINQIAPIPLKDWIGTDPWQEQYGIDDLVRKAIIDEVEKVVSQREAARKEAERKLEAMKMESAQKLQFPMDRGSSIKRFFE